MKADEKLDLQIKSLKTFRQLFDEFTETVIYRDQVKTFPNYLHKEMDNVESKIEHPSVQQ